MIRGDNACALLSYCFKPFANSEEAPLNSYSGGALSKLKGEKLSFLHKKILTLGMKWADSPKSNIPQRTAEHPGFVTWGPDSSPPALQDHPHAKV